MSRHCTKGARSRDCDTQVLKSEEAYLADISNDTLSAPNDKELVLQGVNSVMSVLEFQKWLTVFVVHDIIQFTRRITSLGALIAFASGRRSLGDSIDLIGPRSRVKRDSLFAKQVYSDSKIGHLFKKITDENDVRYSPETDMK